MKTEIVKLPENAERIVDLSATIEQSHVDLIEIAEKIGYDTVKLEKAFFSYYGEIANLLLVAMDRKL